MSEKKSTLMQKSTALWWSDVHAGVIFCSLWNYCGFRNFI